MGGVSLQAKNFEFSPPVEYHPHQKIKSTCPLIADYILEKKGFNSFYTDFIKNSAEGCIFSKTIMTYLKKLIGTKFQQDHLPQLFPIVSLTIYGKPWRWGESHSIAKNVLIYPTRKTHLMKFILLSKVSFLPHEIVIFI